MDTTEPTWPALLVADWEDTRDTLHLWTQMVGKLRLALTPRVNHWWNVPLYVDARGLTTSLMPCGAHGLEVRFDFFAHELAFERTDGARRTMALEPRSVADFYREFTEVLGELEVPARIHPMPVEIAGAIPFADDETHASYDADAVHRFWLTLVPAARVLGAFRAEWDGKASPVHFFWGAFDLAESRFSGRTARCARRSIPRPCCSTSCGRPTAPAPRPAGGRRRWIPRLSPPGPRACRGDAEIS